MKAISAHHEYKVGLNSGNWYGVRESGLPSDREVIGDLEDDNSVFACGLFGIGTSKIKKPKARNENEGD
ncbi:MAG: hypothetical protein V1889_03485 [archaeon]